MMSYFHHLFFPRESNNHRAKVLQYPGLLTLIALLLLGQFSLSIISKTTSVLGAASDIPVSDLLAKTNAVRVAHGLSALTLNSELTAAATAKGQDMFTHNYWAHNSPEGLTPWVFIKGANYNYLYAGENLARGFSSAGGVMDAWMASPGHRENILSPHYNDIGFAVLSGNLTGEDTTLVVEEFGSQNSAVAETSSQILPTPTIVEQVAGTKTGQVSQTIPTGVASPPAVVNKTVGSIPSPIMHQSQLIAGAGIEPLTNKRSVTVPIALGVLGLLILVLFADILIIERNKIVRVVSHNVDHIIYLTIIILIIFIVGRGITL